MLKFTYTLNGIQAVRQWLIIQTSFFKNLNKPLEQIAADFYDTERQWFESEGGGRWKPLSPRYAAWKNSVFPGKPLMRMTDRMYREFTGETKHYQLRNGSLSIYALGVPYWIEHDEGRPDTRLPQREIMAPWLEQRIPHWHDIVTNYISSQFTNGSIGGKP